ncbi:hypothetical protein HYPSUDRAFT_31544 [Hypholoma sublateritium FD-334 SS-4]|uniref:ABM domain-containing protein n=1 Tax=Hypholoma sublateritium (strain FD-334 SS-4) TaxID=945553 RepID=A0A0D2LNG4_HYPSF|nr:hypothetical protein HYPSUDRAFT_31544 [Hypholoma sublateritium FD-334 SS-4]
MPILDVIVFKPTEEPKASPALQSFFSSLKQYKGIIGAWHGVQVEDPTQYHLLVFWESFSHVQEASKDLYYPSLPTGLPAMDSSLQRKLLNINEYPESALAAPITDITYMFLKENKTYEEDLQPILVRFTELASGAKGAYWGQSLDEAGVSIIMIGWDSVQEHYDAGKIPAYKELNDAAIPVVTFALKHVPFDQIF